MIDSEEYTALMIAYISIGVVISFKTIGTHELIITALFNIPKYFAGTVMLCPS